MSTGADLSWDAYDLAHDAALRTGGDLVRAQAHLTYRWRRTPTPTEAIVRRMAMDVLDDAATESERACFRALLADPDVRTYDDAVAAQARWLADFLDTLRAAA